MKTKKLKFSKYAQAVIDREQDSSEWDENDWVEQVMKIAKIKTKNDIIDYYMEERGWEGSTSLMKHLMHFIASLD